MLINADIWVMKKMFSSEITLENERVRLKPLLDLDIDILLSFVKSEPNLWQYSTIPPNTPERMKSYLSKAISDRSRGDSHPFLVYDKLKDSYAGCTRFYDYQDNHDTCQHGYTWIGKQYQGTGLNKNCKYLMLEFAFERIKLQRVEFRADANNARSIAAMKSIGRTIGGILRQNHKKLDGRRDSIILSILADEWHDSIKENLRTKINSERIG